MQGRTEDFLANMNCDSQCSSAPKKQAIIFTVYFTSASNNKIFLN